MTDRKVSALILAGGRSTRLGRDKVWLPLDGEPLVVRMIKRIHALADDVIISTNTPDRFHNVAFNLPVPLRTVVDEHPGMGPLAGLYSGLRAARHDLVLALAVDMPFASLGLLRYLIHQAGGFDAVVPYLAKGETAGWEPLHALYRRSCLPAIESRLLAGDRKVISFYPSIRIRSLLAEEMMCFDPQGRSFMNLNTEEDWRLAQMLVAKRPLRTSLVERPRATYVQMY